MVKLDRLGWAAGTCFDAYGVRVGVRVNKPEVLPQLASLFPPGSKPAAFPLVDQIYSVWLAEDRARARGFHLLYAGVSRRARTTSPDEGLEAFAADPRPSGAAAAPRRPLVHAGGVGWRGGARAPRRPRRGRESTLGGAPGAARG